MILPTGTVTFLFTDIEGSTKLWQQHPEAMRSALAHHDALLREAIESNNGTVFKTVGDAFCAVFATAPEALKAALAAQQAIQTQAWEEIESLRVRMALHTGIAEQRDGDYFGTTLHRVARLLSVGHGEQALLSSATEELVRDALPQGTRLKDLGLHRLRDLERPEQVFQMLHPGLPSEFPPLRSLEFLPNNLPIQMTSFIGREKEMAEVRDLLSAHRLLTLTGSGGCGKTRLALQVAADLLEVFPDGVWLLELAPLAESALVLQTALSTLGLREESDRPLIQVLTDYLKAKTLLIILDNCEHLLIACAQLADSLLRTCPNLRILASSREALGVAGEVPYRIPSLSLPDLKQTPSFEQLLAYEAVRLFIERAKTILPSFTVTANNATVIAQVCSRLDGIPLAIELAAARVRALPTEQIASRLDDRFRLLTGGSRTALPRQQTLRALIDWSYDLLTNSEKILFRRLSVFMGGSTLEAAEQVTGDRDTPNAEDGSGKSEGSGLFRILTPDSRIPPEEVLDLLTSLVDKSLVVYEECRGQARYRLLETVRQYSRDKLLESGEGETIRDRHLDYFLAFAEEAEPKLHGPEQFTWLDCLEIEHENLRAALDWSLALASGAVKALRLAGALYLFWMIRGYHTEGRRWLKAALTRPGASQPSEARGKALVVAGVLALFQGEYETPHTLFVEARSLAEQHGSSHRLAWTMAGQGYLATRRGDAASGQSLLEESLEIFRTQSDLFGISVALTGLSGAAFFQGNNALARSLAEEALAVQRQMGDRLSQASTFIELAEMAYIQGDNASARLLYAEGMTIGRAGGDRGCISAALNGLGKVAVNEGDLAAARAYYAESLAIRREVGDRRGIAGSLNNVGLVASYEGDYTTARSLLEESLAIYRELGDSRGVVLSMDNLGWVAVLENSYERANKLYRESLALCRELGFRRLAVDALEGMSAVFQGYGRPGKAARLWGAAETLREHLDAPLSPVERLECDRLIAAARAALGAEAFAAAWAEGRALSLEQALSYALEDEIG